MRNKTFSDLFSEAKPWNFKQHRDRERYLMAGAVAVGTFFSDTGNCLDVTPAKPTLDDLQDSMISINYDRIYFSAAHHDDGTTSIYANYNSINGSRRLATIPTNSIPKFSKEQHAEQQK